MERAEQLKAILAGSPDAASAGGGAAVAKPGAGDRTDDGDAEKKKLQGALSGAILAERPNIKWSDVAGLEGAKDALKEAVILPAKFPQLFTGKRQPWRGVLLYGPPGTGKSFLAKAVATEADSTFFSVSSSDLVSKWQGESERLVRNLFEMAREAKPSIIFIDEIDSLCTARSEGENDASRRIKTEFLVQMQGVGKDDTGVLVLGATNTPWEIDSAMRRRFEKRILINLPSAPARARMLQLGLGDTPHNLTAADFDHFADVTDGFSGSDIAVMVRQALMEPLRKCRQARYFRRTSDGGYMPVPVDPPCARCPLDLSSSAAPRQVPCKYCGCERLDLMDIPGDQLRVPNVTAEDFAKISGSAKSSVGVAELERYAAWTAEYGEEGL